MSHITINPAILYWGTPVAIVSSLNADGTTNLCAMSSAWWLGNRCLLGFAAYSATPQNMQRHGACVLNLPAPGQLDAINALASSTGTADVPAAKAGRGYRYVHDKWALTGLTPQASTLVAPVLRVAECPIQMECTMVKTHALMSDVPDLAGALVALEVTVRRVHILPHLQMPGHPHRIDPDQLQLLIMSFQQLYTTNPTRIGPSDLARVPEEKYRLPPAARGILLDAERCEDGERATPTSAAAATLTADVTTNGEAVA